MKRSFIIAMIFAVGAAAWIVSGQLGEDGPQAEVRKPPIDVSETTEPTSVRVALLTAETHVSHHVVRGHTEAPRSVDTKAEIDGRVVEFLAGKGQAVEAGQPIARLAEEDRQAALDEAQAVLRQRQIEYEAARKLADKGFRAKTDLAAQRAALDAAHAQVKRAELAIEDLEIIAPFRGVLEHRVAEVGDYVKRGEPVARIVELDPMLAVAQVNERRRNELAVGQIANVRLITGETVEAVVSFIAAAADEATRTYRLEAEIDNADGTVPAGMTAEIRLPLQPVKAHRVSPAALTLSDEGEVGVMTVDAEDHARFRAVKIVEDGPDAAWITGLPEQVTMIVVGQEFVVDGEPVKPVPVGKVTPQQADEAVEAGS